MKNSCGIARFPRDSINMAFLLFEKVCIAPQDNKSTIHSTVEHNSWHVKCVIKDPNLLDAMYPLIFTGRQHSSAMQALY